MKKTNRYAHYILWYTAAFAVMAALSLGVPAIRGRLLVQRGDGLRQHLRAAGFFGRYIRQILTTLIKEHRLEIPAWSFSLGYGSNVAVTLHYYGFGDPLTLLTALLPEHLAGVAMTALDVVRLYLSGLAFSVLLISMDRAPSPVMMTGALMYAFSQVAVRTGTKHPFFLLPMILFPLVLAGCEQLLRRRRPALLVGSVLLTALCNVYFFYMIAILTAVYVLVRSLCLGWRCRAEALHYIGAVTYYSLAATLMSMVLLWPVICAYRADVRSVSDPQIPLLYPLKYYAALVLGAVGSLAPGYSTLLAFGAPALAALLALVLSGRGRHRELKILTVLAAAALSVPAAGYLLNGTSYIANRWDWAAALLASCTVVRLWDELLAMMKQRRGVYVLAGIILYTLMTAASAVLLPRLGISRQAYGIILAMLCQLLVTALLLDRIRRTSADTHRPALHRICLRASADTRLPALLMITVLAGTAFNAAYYYSGYGYNYISRLYSRQQIESYVDADPDRVIASVTQDEPFSRYGGDTADNASLWWDTHGLQYYWSLSNGYVAQFLETLQVNVHRLYEYDGLDDRTALTTLASVRYYIRAGSEGDGDPALPAGYMRVASEDGYSVYENEHALGLCYVYQDTMTQEYFRSLNGAQKEEALMQAVLLDGADGAAEAIPAQGVTGDEVSGSASVDDGGEAAIRLTGQKCAAVRISAGDGVTCEAAGDGMIFTVSEDGAGVVLEAQVSREGEASLIYSGLVYEGAATRWTLKAQGAWEDGSSRTEQVYYADETEQWPADCSSRVLNLGSGHAGTLQVTVTFPKKGTYSFEEWYLWEQPLEIYERAAEARQALWTDEVIGADTVSGTVRLEEDSIAVLTIPYDGGWSAEVDGQAWEVERANIMYTALRLPAGEHTIVLRYRTPGLSTGMILALAGLVMTAAAAIRRRRNVKNSCFC